MNTYKLLLLVFLGSLLLQSCNKRKLTEVVEVPLPSVDEKITIGLPEDVRAEDGEFSMTKLTDNYEAFAPSIGILTMENHYSKHYLTYTNNLNKIVAENQSLLNIGIEQLLSKLDLSNEDLRNNAGGYYNHTLFFENLTAKSEGQPKDTLAACITRDFGGFDLFKAQFTEVAENQFGSGWAWLIVDKTGKLQITSTTNQDNPLMPKQLISGKPILNIDVWEHAYYLDYQYKRRRYINNFYKVINWKKVSKRFEEAIAKK